MDAATISAVLAMVFADTDGAADSQLRDGLASLFQRLGERTAVNRPGVAALNSGEAEISALRHSPHDSQKVGALAVILLARAEADSGFEDALKGWLEKARPLHASSGNVANAIQDSSPGVAVQGRDFHNVIINNGYPAPVAPASEMQLPPLIESFVGRDDDLERLVNLLDPARGEGSVRVIVGLAGAGKTALATHAAHAALKKNLFPGGVLFADLHGYDDEPTQPGEMLERLLRALLRDTGAAVAARKRAAQGLDHF